MHGIRAEREKKRYKKSRKYRRKSFRIFCIFWSIDSIPRKLEAEKEWGSRGRRFESSHSRQNSAKSFDFAEFFFIFWQKNVKIRSSLSIR